MRRPLHVVAGTARARWYMDSGFTCTVRSVRRRYPPPSFTAARPAQHAIFHLSTVTGQAPDVTSEATHTTPFIHVHHSADNFANNTCTDRQQHGSGAEPNEKQHQEEIEDLARALLSRGSSIHANSAQPRQPLLLEPHVGGSGFVASPASAASTLDALFHDAARVIRHYGRAARTSRALRVSPELVRRPALITGTSPSGVVAVPSRTPSAKMIKLPNAEVCCAMLTLHILPEPRGMILTQSTVDDAIDLAEVTIRALAREKSTVRSRLIGGGDDDPLRNGKSAEEILRRLLSASYRDDTDTDGRSTESSSGRQQRQWKRQRAVMRTYNATLNAWASAASSGIGAGPAVSKHAAQQAERLLLEMAQAHEHGTDDDDDANSDNDDGSRCIRSEQLQQDDTSNLLQNYVKPDAVSFNTVISSWARSGRRTTNHGTATEGDDNRDHGSRFNKLRRQQQDTATAAAERAESILRLMQELADEAGPDAAAAAAAHATEAAIHPTTKSYNAVIQAWAKSAHPNATRRAAALLEEMSERSMKRGDNISSSSCHPDEKTFALVMHAYARSGLPNAAREADAVFNTMNNVFGIPPNVIVYNALLDALARHAGRKWEARYESCLRMDDIICQMEENVESCDGSNTAPDSVSYGTAIMAWSTLARSLSRDGSKAGKDKCLECSARAEQHLRTMLDTHMWQGSGHRGGRQQRGSVPFIHAVNDVISAWTAAGAPEKAEVVFELATTIPNIVKMNAVTYSLLVHAFAECASRHAGAAEKAEYYLLSMERNLSVNNRRVGDQTDTAVYNAAISGWTRCRPSRQECVERADALLSRMIKEYEHGLDLAVAQSDSEEGDVTPQPIIKAPRPNTYSFVTVISGYSRLCRSNSDSITRYCDRVEDLLRRMEAMHDFSRRLSPNSKLSKKNVANVIPNVVGYNILLDMYSKRCQLDKKAARRDVLAKSERIFQRMKDLYSSGLNSECKPDQYSLCTMLNILANSGVNGAGNKAVGMLEQVRDLGWTRNSDQRSNADSFNLDTSVYNAVLKVLSNDGSVEQAESLLLEMERGLLSGNESKLSTPYPDRISYTTVISGWARQGTLVAAKRAEALLVRLKESHSAAHAGQKAALNLQPDTYVYNSVISTFAKTKTFEGAQKAEALIQEMDQLYRSGSNKQVRPDAWTLKMADRFTAELARYRRVEKRKLGT